MFDYLKKILLFSAVFVSGIAQSAESIQDNMASELNNLKYFLKLKYVPLEWKQEHFKYDLDKTFDRLTNKIYAEKITGAAGYRKIFNEAVRSLKDYHASAYFYSTAYAFFPFTVKAHAGRYYISIPGLDVSQADPSLVWLEKGAELLSIDGVPVGELIEKLAGDDNTPTGHALAARMLFMRMGFIGHEVPKGNFVLALKDYDEKNIFTCTLPWLHQEEMVSDPTFKEISEITKENCLHHLYKKDYSVQLAKKTLLGPSHKKALLQKFCPACDDEDGEDMDMRWKGSLPPLGKILWETDTDCQFYAYIYENGKGQPVGYLHIPTFSVFSPSESMAALIPIIQRFNAETEALVLDIKGNPGGYYPYMCGVLSLLTDKPIKSLSQKEMLTHEDAYYAAMTISCFANDDDEDEEVDPNKIIDFYGWSITQSQFQEIIDNCKEILNSWNSGQNVTQILPMSGIQEVRPHPEVSYGKPLLVLIDELNFSCGDLFPAMIQDSRRGVLFGKKTAGAGGYYYSTQTLSRFGIMGHSIAASLIYRADGSVIENLGVRPDVPFDITRKDIVENCPDYIKAVNTTLKKMIRK